MLYTMAKHCWADECEAVMGHQLGAQGPQDRLEAFDELEIGLYLGQLEIGLDMICYDLIGPSLGGQESSLSIREVMYPGGER